MSHKHDCSQKLLAAQTLWAWSLSSDIRYPPPYTTMSLCHYVALHWTSYNPGLMVLSPGRPLPRCLADIEVETAVKTPTSKWANFFATCLCLRLLISLARKTVLTIRVKICQELSTHYTGGSLNLADWPRHTCCNMVKLGPTRRTYRNNWRSTRGYCTVFIWDLGENLYNLM